MLGKKKEEVQKNPNEFEFNKTKGFGAYNFVFVTTKVICGENSLSVDHTRKIMFFKGKTKTDTVDYQLIEKLEIRNYFSKGDLISGIIIGIISLITLQLWGLIITAFMIVFSYGKNVLIIKKDSSAVCLQIGGPLSGGIGQKEEIDKFVAMLKKKTSRHLL